MTPIRRTSHRGTSRCSIPCESSVVEDAERQDREPGRDVATSQMFAVTRWVALRRRARQELRENLPSRKIAAIEPAAARDTRSRRRPEDGRVVGEGDGRTGKPADERGSQIGGDRATPAKARHTTRAPGKEAGGAAREVEHASVHTGRSTASTSASRTGERMRMNATRIRGRSPAARGPGPRLHERREVEDRRGQCEAGPARPNARRRPTSRSPSAQQPPPRRSCRRAPARRRRTATPPA